MKKRSWLAIAAFLQFSCFFLEPCLGQVPGILNYQGRVAVNGTNFDGTGQFKFALVDGGTNSARQAAAIAHVVAGFVVSNSVNYGGAAYVTPPNVSYQGGGGSGAVAHALIGGGAVTSVVVDSPGAGYASAPTVVIDPPPISMNYLTFWSNDGASTAGSQPAAPVSLTVAKGIYSVLLGDTHITGMQSAVPVQAFANPDVRLRIWFSSGANGFQQLAPDQRIAAVGYALMANSVATGAITTSMLADGAITPTKLAPNALDLSGTAVTGTVPDIRLSPNVALLDANQTFSGQNAFAGNVGIGTTTPAYSLVVQKSPGTAPAIMIGGSFPGGPRFQTYDLTDDAHAWMGFGTDMGGGPYEHSLYFPALAVNPNVGSQTIGSYDGTTYSEKLRVTAAGNVGIGTNDPQAKLTVHVPGMSTPIRALDIDVQSFGSPENAAVSHYLRMGDLGGGTAPALIVKGNGNVGMGIADPQATLDVAGTVRALSFAGNGSGLSNLTIATSGDISGQRLNIGSRHVLSGLYSSIGGGTSNTNAAEYSFVGGGGWNLIQANADWSVMDGGFQNSIRPSAAGSVVGGGVGNTIQTGAGSSVVGGGAQNSIQVNAARSVVGGGYWNSIQVDAFDSVLGGGSGNSIQSNAYGSVLGGGSGNSIQTNAYGSVVGGGAQNSIQTGANLSFVGGGEANSILSNAIFSVVGGGERNSIHTNAYVSVVGGGSRNSIQLSAMYSVVGGGSMNSIQPFSSFSVVGGGNANSIQFAAYQSVMGGGGGNSIQTNAYQSVVGGGGGNSIQTNAHESVVGGGAANVVSAPYSTIPGGTENEAAGMYSFAAGNRAKARHKGSFVWGDSTAGDVSSTSPNQFVIRATGGIAINDADIQLRTPDDRNHGLGWYGASKLFAGENLNGPALYGNEHGALGTVTGSQTNIALLWDGAQAVTVNGNMGVGTAPTPNARLTVAGDVTVNGSVAAENIFKWTITSGSPQAVPNTGYILTRDSSRATIALPGAPVIGQTIRIAGVGTGGWKIHQNAGQSILAGKIPVSGTVWTAHGTDRGWASVASSADGTKLVAVVDGGQIYTSTDSGMNWTERSINESFMHPYSSIASSADGTKLVVSIYGGTLLTSTDSGVNWTGRTFAGANWMSVASSWDGTRLVAVIYGGSIYTSTDSGLNWFPRMIDGERPWRSVASSTDGTRLVAVASIEPS